MSKKSRIGWIVAVLAPVVLLLIPCTGAYTLQIKEFFAILTFAMIMFAFELFSNNMIPSLILSMLFLVLHLGTSDQIFSAWGNSFRWPLVVSRTDVRRRERSSQILAAITAGRKLTGG